MTFVLPAKLPSPYCDLESKPGEGALQPCSTIFVLLSALSSGQLGVPHDQKILPSLHTMCMAYLVYISHYVPVGQGLYVWLVRTQHHGSEFILRLSVLYIMTVLGHFSLGAGYLQRLPKILRRSFASPAAAWSYTPPSSDIIYARLLNKPVVVINSEEVAKDLFEGRSTIYSDKPQSIVYEYFASDFNAALFPYGDRWRLHRRMYHQAFRQGEIPSYHAVQLRSAHKMLFSLLQDPSDYSSHFEMFTVSSMLSIVYDYEPKSEDDHIAHIMRTYLDQVVVALTPGATVILETFPFLLKLPTWFPGATFKRASLECLKAGHDIKEIPFQLVERRMSTGGAASCFVTESLNRMRCSEEKVTAIKEAASVAFAAAFETTTSTLLVFILAMVLNPEVQAKAQAEIDRIIGKDRLPDFNDRPALPYLDAIWRETLRWQPVLPFGTPGATTTSDVYKGYFIPKGVVLFTNTWAMTHDEMKYPSPDEFKPDRFLHEDGSLTSDTMSIGFGFGRRMCVGRHVADASVWIVITSFLAMFSAHKALDEHGIDIPVVPKFSSGLTVHPEKFPCRIVPRFPDTSVKTLEDLTGLAAEQL